MRWYRDHLFRVGATVADPADPPPPATPDVAEQA